MDTFDFVNRANADYIDRLYLQYQKDPRSVDEQWTAFFAGFEFGHDKAAAIATSDGSDGAPANAEAVNATIGLFDLVHSYRELGHFVSKLDPLGHDRPNHPLLELSNFGINPAMLDKPTGGGGFVGWTVGSLRDLIEKLRATYCRSIGVEFTGISDKAQREWLQARMEPIENKPFFSQTESRNLLGELVAAEEFERYLKKVFGNAKRFGLEGGESLIPLLEHAGRGRGRAGCREGDPGHGPPGPAEHAGPRAEQAVRGDPQRVHGNQFAARFTEGDGDVKYHLGYANTRSLASGKKVKVSLLPNPSHLELIDPIQQGIVPLPTGGGRGQGPHPRAARDDPRRRVVHRPGDHPRDA